MATIAGNLILIVEDEALIALDIASAFMDAGADVAIASNLTEAKLLVSEPKPSAVIVDLGLPDGPADELCSLLTERRIPFIIHKRL